MSQSLFLAQRLNFFGGPALGPDERAALAAAAAPGGGHREDRVVVLADCTLDQPRTLKALGTLLAGVLAAGSGAGGGCGALGTQAFSLTVGLKCNHFAIAWRSQGCCLQREVHGTQHNDGHG
jgi:hypothetical protein